MTARPGDTSQANTPLPGAAADGPGWRLLDEPASVRFHPWGSPLVLHWRGNLWQVITQPESWSGPDNGREPGPTPLGGQGSIITTRFWRFQTQTGPVSPVLEFEISSDPRWEHWRLRRVRGVQGY